MTEYNLSLADVLALADGTEIEADVPSDLMQISNNQLCWSLTKYAVPVTAWLLARQFRVKINPPKLVKWYRPKVVWYDGRSRPEHWLGSEFYLSKEDWQDDFPHLKILVWGDIEAPETFGELE